MLHLLTFTWDQPLGLEIGSFTLRYYSLLFAGGFFAGYYVFKRFAKNDNMPEKWLDSLLTYMVVSTVLGARLGHVFFYEWGYYKNHPEKILAVWEGGLASHGAAVAIILALIIWSRRVSKKSPLWVLDRIVIVVALAGGFIRLGNMMNSEIYGKPANSAIETVYINPVRESLLGTAGDRIEEIDFTPLDRTLETDSLTYPLYTMRVTFVPEHEPRVAKTFVERYIATQLNNRTLDDRNIMVAAGTEATLVNENSPAVVSMEVMGIPRYPTQVIESLGYFLIFVLLYFLYWRTSRIKEMGFIFGAFLVSIFGFRFLVEFLKANQVAFEANMNLNMGQWLSIPLVLAGLYFMFTAKNRMDADNS
jgi:phosphatidylglycerol:prolipoprotein diacylglycerol transferase